MSTPILQNSIDSPIAPTAATKAARAVVYLRVSTKEQAERGGEAEGFSIPAQREACFRKADQLNAEVLEVFADRGESAKSAHRPELQRMLLFVRDNAVDYVIVHKVDRLARNRADDVQINLAIKEAGATLVSCTENIDETPSGTLMHGIMSSIAEFYSRNLANEVIKGSTQKAKSGGTIGKAPVGYLNVRRIEQGTEIRTVELDPERNPLMAWVFEQYATGRWSIRKLLAEATDRGLTSTPSPRRPAQPLALSHFNRLLRNPYYTGVVTYRGVQYEGNHTPLVDTDTWQQVQRRLDAANTAGNKTQRHFHYLTGSVHCGSCGGRLIVSKAKNRHGTTYEYFICIERQKKSRDCAQKALLIDQVAAFIEDYYGDVQLTPDEADDLRGQLVDSLAGVRGAAERDRGTQQRRLQRLNAERKKLLEAFYDDALPADLFKAEQARITAEADQARRRLDALGSDFDVIDANINLSIEFGRHCQGAYLAASDNVRRSLNQALFHKLYVHEDHVEGELNAPFDLILDQDGEIAAATAAGPAITATTKNPRHHEDVEGLNVSGLVDLQGRLSNPPYNFGRSVTAMPRIMARSADVAAERRAATQRQHRLKPADIDDLVQMYQDGSAVPIVAAAFGINRDTVYQHLERRGVNRRASLRKLTDADVQLAGARYVSGEPMAQLCEHFAVDPKTLHRELKAVEVPLRKPGRPTRRSI